MTTVAPDLPLTVEAGPLTIQIHQDPEIEWPGCVGWAYDHSPCVLLRDGWDERIVLHEVLHIGCATTAGLRAPRDLDDEERLVRQLTSVLYGMGWRWKGVDRTEQQRERDSLMIRERSQALWSALDQALGILEKGPATGTVTGAAAVLRQARDEVIP